MHLPSKQSILALKMSSLFWMEKLMKLVSMMILYGGPSALLCVKNRHEGSFGLDYQYVYSSLTSTSSGACLAMAYWRLRSCSYSFALFYLLGRMEGTFYGLWRRLFASLMRTYLLSFSFPLYYKPIHKGRQNISWGWDIPTPKNSKLNIFFMYNILIHLFPSLIKAIISYLIIDEPQPRLKRPLHKPNNPKPKPSNLQIPNRNSSQRHRVAYFLVLHLRRCWILRECV